MLDFLLKILGDPNEKKIKNMMGIVDHINALEPQFAAMSDDELRAKTDEFKEILAKRPTSKDFKTDRKLEKEALDKILPEAFATVREAGKRVLNMRHFDVQLIGGYFLHNGHIAEKGIVYARSMYNIQHKVTPENGGLKLNLECIRPDVEIRYTIDGSEPVANSSVYSDSLIVTGTQLIKCATFAEGVQMGKTLVLPITWNKATAKTILGNKQNEMLMLNGVRGSLKQTDFEWCCWDKNDLISFTIDLQQKEKMNTFTIGCITNYGMGVHKPKSIRIAVSDDNKSYRDVTGLNYTPEEIFREGTYIEDLSMDMKGTEARYIRVTVNGAGECPANHVRPGQESRVYFDEIIIE